MDKNIERKKIFSRPRRIIAALIAFSVVMASIILFTSTVIAADPAINFTNPANGGLFADTNDGDGVNLVVNVTDGDGDIAWVHLYSNDSGTWQLFYNSGALGGVAYHNVTVQNENWTGSWTKYYYNISANDGTSHDTIYSFTTGYQWGDPQVINLGDEGSGVAYGAYMYKNATGDYYCWYPDIDIVEGYKLKVFNNIVDTNWTGRTATVVATGLSDTAGCYGAFTYNNQPSIICRTGTKWSFAYHDESGWHSYQTAYTAKYGGDIEYYDGQWQFVFDSSTYIMHYSGTPYSTWTAVTTTLATGVYSTIDTLDGYLVCVYKETSSNDLHWKTWDGVTWTDKGDITPNVAAGSVCTMVKDPVNSQLVLVYENRTANPDTLCYRVLSDVTGSWSNECIIMTDASGDINFPGVSYMDRRLVCCFSYKLRGQWDLYSISAPDYTASTSGLDTTYNRIQWDHANPDDEHVNSTIFVLKNIDNRSIATITWHFEDIGDITAASNINVWTNMSGAWSNIGTCDANGDINTLDISGLMAGGAEWVPGQTTWWEAEILDVGPVVEDLHSTDEDIYYKVTFA